MLNNQLSKKGKLVERLTGIGWSDPIKILNGSYKKVSGTELINQSIRRRLTTRYGERVMRPRFGAMLIRHIFDLGSPAFELKVQASVVEALKEESKIKVENVMISETEDEQVYRLVIYYKLVGSDNLEQFTLPFREGRFM